MVCQDLVAIILCTAGIVVDFAAVFETSGRVDDSTDQIGRRGRKTSSLVGNRNPVQIDINLPAIASSHIVALESRIQIDEEFELSYVAGSERCSLKHAHGVVKVPGDVLHLKREVSEQIVYCSGSCEGVGVVLIGISGHVAHSKGIDRYCRKINYSKNDDLTIGRQFCKSCDDPRICVLDNTAHLSLNI